MYAVSTVEHTVYAVSFYLTENSVLLYCALITPPKKKKIALFPLQLFFDKLPFAHI